MATTPGTIKHRKQSTLPTAGYDVDVPQWNDSEVMAGGTTGQVCTRDTAQTDGWGWSTIAATEFGNWTPTLGGNAGGSGGSYAIQTGRYQRIGQLLIAHFEVQFNVKATFSGAGVYVYGLPYASNQPSNITGYSTSVRFANLVTNYIWVQCLVLAGQNYAILQGQTAAAGSSGAAGMGATDLGNTSGFAGTLTYFLP